MSNSRRDPKMIRRKLTPWWRRSRPRVVKWACQAFWFAILMGVLWGIQALTE